MEKRMITTDVTEEDLPLEGSLRPQTLDEYIGQEKTKKTLKIYIEAAKQRHDALDHVLFYGPPGLGKTTLSGIIANEMGTHMKVTSGPAIEKPGEMAAILNNLQEGDILFVDEIHRLNRQVEEVLYPAMEDFAIDIMIGKGASARSIRLDLHWLVLPQELGFFLLRCVTVSVLCTTWNSIIIKNYRQLCCALHRCWESKLMQKVLRKLPNVPVEQLVLQIAFSKEYVILPR